jgi:putative membrane protein
MKGIGTPPADAGTLLAVDRTRLAYERTMMAWVRTGMSLISFGFTVYKFFQYQVEHGQMAASGRLIGPREFAMVMIGLGLVSVLLSSFDHHHSLAKLKAAYGPQPRSTAALVGLLVSLVGLGMFMATVLGL